jgi:hypothetical protein
MLEAKHTPGPWTLDEFNDYVDGTNMEVLDEQNFPVADILAHPLLNRWHERFPAMAHWADGVADGLTQVDRAQDELLANARLVAAAPVLLDALVSLTNSASGLSFRETAIETIVGLTNWRVLQQHIDDARAAITKATQP